MVYYISVLKPLDSKAGMVFELINEFALLVVSYCLIPFGLNYFSEDTA